MTTCRAERQEGRKGSRPSSWASVKTARRPLMARGGGKKAAVPPAPLVKDPAKYKAGAAGRPSHPPPHSPTCARPTAARAIHPAAECGSMLGAARASGCAGGSDAHCQPAHSAPRAAARGAPLDATPHLWLMATLPGCCPCLYAD